MFGLGKIPKIPGTFGSLATIIILYILLITIMLLFYKTYFKNTETVSQNTSPPKTDSVEKGETDLIKNAYNICKYVKSNSIVITNNFSTIGIGAGQPSRVDSCNIAVQKAKKFQPKKLKNSIAASDAFFPFSDGVKKLINAGIKLIIQPGVATALAPVVSDDDDELDLDVVGPRASTDISPEEPVAEAGQ